MTGETISSQAGAASAEPGSAAIKRTPSTVPLAADGGASLDEQVADIVATSILVKDWRFVVNGAEMPADEVANPRSMLPAILWNVEKMHRIAFGSGLGIRFRSEPDAFIGATAVLDIAAGQPRAPLVMFSLETLYQAVENHPTPDGGASLDHLVRDFFIDNDNGVVPWVSAPARVVEPAARHE